MQRNWKFITGASAAALAVVVASQTGPFTRSQGDDAPARAEGRIAQTAPETAPVAETVPVAPDPAPALQAEITRLTALLAEREVAYSLVTEALAGRDADIGRLTATLAERDAELTALRAEILALRAEVEFDAQLAAMKSGDGPGNPSAARIEAARFETARVEARDPDTFSDTALDTGKPPDTRPALPVGEQRLSQIHFDPSSSRLSPGGRAHAAAAAVTLADMAVGRIRLIGYTDRVGGPVRNRALAAARARAVADFLIEAGLAGASIEIDGMGETGTPVSTDDGVAEPLNRCVEIVVTPL